MNEFISLEEAAKILGCNKSHIYNLIRKGTIIKYKRLGKALVKRSDVEALCIPKPEIKEAV